MHSFISLAFLIFLFLLSFFYGGIEYKPRKYMQNNFENTSAQLMLVDSAQLMLVDNRYYFTPANNHYLSSLLQHSSTAIKQKCLKSFKAFKDYNNVILVYEQLKIILLISF